MLIKFTSINPNRLLQCHCVIACAQPTELYYELTYLHVAATPAVRMDSIVNKELNWYANENPVSTQFTRYRDGIKKERFCFLSPSSPSSFTAYFLLLLPSSDSCFRFFCLHLSSPLIPLSSNFLSSCSILQFAILLFLFFVLIAFLSTLTSSPSSFFSPCSHLLLRHLFSFSFPFLLCRILGSLSCGYEQFCLLAYNAV
jgi:hypothetical protein